MSRIVLAALLLLAPLCACSTRDVRHERPAGAARPQAGDTRAAGAPPTDDGTTPVSGGATAAEETKATGGTSPSQRGSAFEPNGEEERDDDELSPDEIDPQSADDPDE